AQYDGSVDIANAEFKKMTGEDENLRAEYRDWCHAVGSSEKNGFLDFCQEYMEAQESMWDYLGDLDE
ncbi:MAG: hypothetical protein K2O12_01725, partial [Muribaculaceae bacterium]|nr:hypothetical protein [Muribaculaceae bacterium]